MPAYAFAIRWDDDEKVSWTYLPTDDRARDFARILMQNFKASDQYSGTAQMTVKNNKGTEIATLAF
jgi:hypothetical protein